MYALTDKIYYCENKNDANDKFYATDTYLHQCGFKLDIDDDSNLGSLEWYNDNYLVIRADGCQHGLYNEGHEVKMLRCMYDQLFYEQSALIDVDSEGLEDLEEVATDGRYYDEEEDEYPEIFYYELIDRETAQMLVDRTDELIYLIPKMNVYVLGVTHYGTSWANIATRIKI